MLSKETLLSSLSTSLFGRKLFVFESIDSTNTCARTLAEAGMEEGAVVLAEYQTSGRGRHGRTWNAEPGENLLFSVLLRPAIPRTSAGFLTFFAAVSVAQALEEVSESRIECKWPNDLLLNGKKVSGILLENTFEKDRVDYSVIGIGINVNQSSFPNHLIPTAT
ncbi:MAG TPA: biotin--[acetyl-CoA-carboxylase] ligase, partial [Bacteroidota bacterium]